MPKLAVTPAKAGVPLPYGGCWSGIPAFAGMTIWGLLTAAFLLLAAPAHAQTFPKLTGRVVDQAGLLSAAQIVDLSTKSDALEAATGRQFVVATVSSLEGRTIEDYGYRLGREWAIGDKERDDGVILLIAPNEKKVRIETGYGARVFLTDAVSSVIIRNSILPRFKAGDMPGGIMAGADAIIETMQLPAAEAAKRAAEAEKVEKKSATGGGPGVLWPAIVVMIVIFAVLLPLRRAAGGRRYRGKGRRGRGFDSGDMAVVLWGLEAVVRTAMDDDDRWGGGGGGGGWGGGGFGGGGGGGFSGGGGSFGGGGASGGW